eukprot:1159629-Pelagomonas_calceolata.AAC.1
MDEHSRGEVACLSMDPPSLQWTYLCVRLRANAVRKGVIRELQFELVLPPTPFPLLAINLIYP